MDKARIWAMMTGMARTLARWDPWEPASPSEVAEIWVSRRDQRIRRPIVSLGSVTADGIPYLAPEIQLFYKARAPRPKDETDFAAALAVLTEPQRQWLSDALSLVYGREHRWRARLPGNA